MENGSCAPCAAAPYATGRALSVGGKRIVSDFAARPSPSNGRTHNLLCFRHTDPSNFVCQVPT
ncbi:hypothetical protein ACI65C_011997 [Semiaphis heraclei]